MSRSGRQDDHRRAGRSLIARIDQAFAGLPGIRLGIEPYLHRLAGHGWPGGELPQESLQQWW
jgi:hypothetical protein